MGNGTDPDRNGTEQILGIQGNMVGMSFQDADGNPIPIRNTSQLIRMEIANKVERIINVSLLWSYIGVGLSGMMLCTLVH